MYKKIILGIVIIFSMMNIASASVRPVFVEMVYGLEPATWLAIAAGIGAVLQHVGRYYIKKRDNPGMKYDTAYLYTTAVTILAGCQVIAGIPVVELEIDAIMFYLFAGVTGTEGVNKITKVKK